MALTTRARGSVHEQSHAAERRGEAVENARAELRASRRRDGAERRRLAVKTFTDGGLSPTEAYRLAFAAELLDAAEGSR